MGGDQDSELLSVCPEDETKESTTNPARLRFRQKYEDVLNHVTFLAKSPNSKQMQGLK